MDYIPIIAAHGAILPVANLPTRTYYAKRVLDAAEVNAIQ